MTVHDDFLIEGMTGFPRDKQSLRVHSLQKNSKKCKRLLLANQQSASHCTSLGVQTHRPSPRPPCRIGCSRSCRVLRLPISRSKLFRWTARVPKCMRMELASALENRVVSHRQISRRMEHQDSYGCRRCLNGHNAFVVARTGIRRARRTQLVTPIGWTKPLTASAGQLFICTAYFKGLLNDQRINNNTVVSRKRYHSLGNTRDAAPCSLQAVRDRQIRSARRT